MLRRKEVEKSNRVPKGRSSINLNQIVREGLTKMVTFERRTKGGEKSHVEIQRRACWAEHHVQTP